MSSSKAKNVPKPPVHKVTVAEATRDVVIFVLGRGKTWQFLVIMVAFWMFRNATMADMKAAAQYLLSHSAFGWGGWALAILVSAISATFIGRLQLAYRRRIKELTDDQNRHNSLPELVSRQLSR